MVNKEGAALMAALFFATILYGPYNSRHSGVNS